jgi:hypothetical protein
MAPKDDHLPGGFPLKRLLFAVVLTAAVSTPAITAEAKPRKHDLEVERQIVRHVEGYGCTSDTVVAWLPKPPKNTWPGVGDWIKGRAYVLAVEVVGRRVTWKVGPDAETCAAMQGDEWSWSTGDASFAAAYRDRLYVIRATRRNGVRSVAGLRTKWRGRQGPSLSAAKRVFGRPTQIQGSHWGRDICYVTWAPLGLRAVFANFAGRPACRAGWFQTARISGPRARQWAVAINGNESVATVDTSLRYLREEALARYDYLGEVWALSHDWLPYGEAGYYPTVSARLAYSDDWDGGNPVRGFGLYIGAAGD